MFNKGTVARFGMDEPPCQNCADRTQNCHSSCERYLTWKNERDKRKEAYIEYQEKEHAFVDRYVRKLKKAGIDRNGHSVK